MSTDESAAAEASEDTANVIARPPLIYLTSILLGLGLSWVFPLRVLPQGIAHALGPALVVVSLLVFALAVREMTRAGTAIPTHQPSSAVVSSGPYRFSRNPIYLTMTLLHLGIAIWVNAATLLATLVVTLVVMRYGVIAREERYLERRFGDAYLEYKASTRRWL